MQKEYISYGIIGGVFTGITIYGIMDWNWGKSKQWGWADEGWFGEDTYSGGADKLGHTYSHYLMQRSFSNIFEWSLGNKQKAVFLSSATAAMVGLLIEVGDGTSDEYGFAVQDLVADVAGVGFGALLECFPVADAFLGLSFSYEFHQSEGDKKRKTMNILNDYSGQKIMVNLRLAGLRAIGVNIPEFMKYIQLDFGYYTRGYTGYDRPDAERTRHPFVGISINFMEFVKDMYGENDRNNFRCRAFQQPFKYYHVPAGYEADYTLR